MASPTVTTIDYRGYNISINPSGTPDGALTDAFLILEPSANPMFTRTLHEHAQNEITTYGSEEEARNHALELARAWVDRHLARVTE